jgi:amidase
MELADNPPSQDVSARKKAEQTSRISAFPQWLLQDPVLNDTRDVTTIARAALSTHEQEIVTQDATSLVSSFKTGRYTAVEVSHAVFHAAVVAHQLTNCLTEVFFEEGLARAAELDLHFQTTGQLVGPLHGD